MERMENNTFNVENDVGTPTLKSKSKSYCSVLQCNTYAGKNVTIHFFPKDDKLRKKWQQTLKIGKPISKYMTVCKKLGTKERRLKRNVIPSQNIPLSSRRLLVRNVLEPASISSNTDEEMPVNLHETISSPVPRQVDEVENMVERRHCKTCCCYSSSGNSSVYVQTNETGDNSFTFINTLNKDENIGPFAGVDLSVVNTIEQSALKVASPE